MSSQLGVVAGIVDPSELPRVGADDLRAQQDMYSVVDEDTEAPIEVGAVTEPVEIRPDEPVSVCVTAEQKEAIDSLGLPPGIGVAGVLEEELRRQVRVARQRQREPDLLQRDAHFVLREPQGEEPGWDGLHGEQAAAFAPFR